MFILVNVKDIKKIENLTIIHDPQFRDNNNIWVYFLQIFFMHRLIFIEKSHLKVICRF
jgi:hypothetical protein